MRHKGVALPAPAAGQALGFRNRGELLGVEEFITEPTVERLGIAVLLRCPRFDLEGASAVTLATLDERVGDKLRTVVAADGRWRGVEAGDPLQHCHPSQP